MMTVGELTAYLKLDDSHFNRGLDQAESKMGRMGSTMGRIGGKVGGFALRGAAVGIAGLGAGLVAGAVAGIKYNSSIEQTTIAMGTMLGSTEQATALIAEVTKMAAATPFEFPELADATKRLVAYGVSAEDAVPLMTRLGDISSALQVPIGELSDLYGKMKVSGRITMEDVNQMAGRGIPIYAALAKVLGKGQEEIRGLVETGKVGFPDIERAFVSMTDKGSMFGGMMKKQSTSFAGLWSTLKDNVTAVFARAVKPLFNWLTETAMPKAIKMVDKFSAGFAKGGFEGGLKALFGEGTASQLISTFGIIKDTVVGIVKVLGKIGSTFIGLPDTVKKFAIAVAALPLALKGFSMLSSGKSIIENLFGKGGPAAANVPLQGALGLNTAATEANTLALGGKGLVPGAGGKPVAAPLGAPGGGAGAVGMGFIRTVAAVAVPIAVGIAAGEMVYRNRPARTQLGEASASGLVNPRSGTIMTPERIALFRKNGEQAGDAFADGIGTRGASIARSLSASGDKAGAGLAAGLANGVGPALQSIQKVRNAAGKPIRTGRLDTSGWTGPMFAAMQRAMEFREMVGRGTTTSSSGPRRPAPPPPPVWHAPGRAAGGNVSGPSSGYPVIMHGEETVVAHNNPSRGLADLAAAGIGGGTHFHFHVGQIIGTDERAARQLWNTVKPIAMSEMRLKGAMSRG